MSSNDSAVEELSIDDFLDEDFKGGGGGRFLDDWKDDKNDSHIDVWLNPKTPVLKFYRYEFPYAGKGKDDVPVIRWYRFNSMEPTAKMKNQYARREDGTREFPAEVDPFGRFIDWLCEEMSFEDTKIKWTDLIMEVGIGKRDTDKTVRRFYAGGVTGDFDSRDLSKEQKAEIFDVCGIRSSDAFKQKLYARSLYLFQVVPNEQTGKTLFAVEPMTLVKQFQTCVASLKERYGEKLGDPTITPRCFRWKYFPNETDNQKKFQCIDMPSAELTDEIKESFEHIGDVKQATGQCNVALLRKYLEEAWCHAEVTPPWDKIFEPAYKKLEGTEWIELPDSFNHGANADEGDKPAPKTEAKTEGGSVRRTRGTPAPEKKPEPPKEEPKAESPKAESKSNVPAPKQLAPKAGPEDLGCDVCERVMSDNDMVCPSCGAEYVNIDGAIGLKHPVDAGTHKLDENGQYVPVVAANAPEAPRARRRSASK